MAAHRRLKEEGADRTLPRLWHHLHCLVPRETYLHHWIADGMAAVLAHYGNEQALEPHLMAACAVRLVDWGNDTDPIVRDYVLDYWNLMHQEEHV